MKAELERLRAVDKAREKKHNQKFKGPCNTSLARLMYQIIHLFDTGFLNKAGKAALFNDPDAPTHAHIEEIIDP